MTYAGIRDVWRGLELARLGRTDEFKALGLMPFKDDPREFSTETTPSRELGLPALRSLVP